MTNEEAIAYVKDWAGRLGVKLDDAIDRMGTVHASNPVGFEFVPNKGGTKLLLSRILDSGRFGLDASDSLFGFAAGSVARLNGYAMSWRQIGTGMSMHIQLGDDKCDVHVDSVGITPAKDKTVNLYDFSKITEHWDKDLRPELGPLKHFDVEIVRGEFDRTGRPQNGLVLSIRKRF